MYFFYSAVRHFAVDSGLVNIQRSTNQKIKKKKERNTRKLFSETNMRCSF